MFILYLYFFIPDSSFASSEVKEVIAPYGRRGVKTIVFLAYFLSSKTYVLTP